MAIFKKPAIKIQDRKKRDIPQGLFQKCPGCDEVIHELDIVYCAATCLVGTGSDTPLPGL
jgi:acetyl-CoA carboxylase beta subunit